MKVLAFGASSSKNSINKQLATYTASLFDKATIEVLDLNDYELPLFSEDKEAEIGKPTLARDFFEKIGSCDILIISFAEHNGSYTAAYKNLFDWCSRIDMKVYQGKPAIFLSTSPGPGGASSVLSLAQESSSFFDVNIKASVSVPSFYDNFDMESFCINNMEIKKQLINAVSSVVL
ncbi:NADPH-dependent FMN reductase [Cycloclasticus zancles]|uniref:FMN reductase n=1 Tax=Cycloclasticus zancles 78-ME TaxID=1198232 RepID=S5T6Q2_9GAMM|nr:NAD(P)H-dependent oxidoreductase [Cycloclasticus zancles]AGS39461.1 FMN reductase [Cycloclasticus zancles 78-ME]